MDLRLLFIKKYVKKNEKNNCRTIQDNTTLGQEIKLAILKKAAIIQNSTISEQQKNYSQGGYVLPAKKKKKSKN